MREIENLRLIYDPNEKTFTEAYALVDGIAHHLEDDSEIRSLIDDLKSQKGVSSLKEISNDYSLAYASNTEAIADFDEEYQDYFDDFATSLSLNEETPYNHEVTDDGISKFVNKKNAIRVAIAGVAVACGLTACSFMKGRANDSEQPVIESITEEEPIVEEINKIIKEAKVNPTSWEEYVSDFNESSQKTMLTKEMDDITSNIVTITVNNVDYKLALSPEEMTAMNYYYNTFGMSNEDMLKIYGTYNLDNEHGEDLINDVHDGLNKMRISLIKAKTSNDVLKFSFDDEEVQRLFDKYVNLMVNYNTATKKSSAKKEIEEALRADFIENGSIMINEHPSATAILQLIPSAMNLHLDPINEKLNVILVGVETNLKVSGVENTIRQNGLVDSSCSFIDRRLKKFDEYREELRIKTNADEQYNEMLYMTVIGNDNFDQEYYESQYKVSEYDKLTEDTYDLSEVMIPLMDEYLSMNYDISASIDYDEINEEIHKGIIAELQAKQLNNTKPFNPDTNPSGGKKGDVFVGETKKGIGAKSSDLTDKQKEDAKKQAKEKDPELVDAENEEEVKEKEEEIKEDLGALCKEAYEAGQAETIKDGRNASINKKYSEHKEKPVRDAYKQGREHGIEIWDELHATNEEKKTEDKDDGAGKHEDNPNQKDDQTATDNGNSSSTDSGNSSSTDGETTTVDDGAGKHEDNPNQKDDQNVTEEITDTNKEDSIPDVIPGTLTEDPEGVEDMSQYGEVMYNSSYNIEDIVDYIANQDDLVDQYTEDQGRQR